MSDQTNESKKKTNPTTKGGAYDIPDKELETPRSPMPDNKENNSGNRVGYGIGNDGIAGAHGNGQGHGAPHFGMTWSQIENPVRVPFPAGVYGVPPYPYMQQHPMQAVPPAVRPMANRRQLPSKKNASTSKKGNDGKEKKPNLRFTEAEKMELMSILEQIVPVSQIDWESVESDFNFNFPDRERTKDALRCFFNSCVKKKSPTGDPKIPAWICKA